MIEKTLAEQVYSCFLALCFGFGGGLLFTGEEILRLFFGGALPVRRHPVFARLPWISPSFFLPRPRTKTKWLRQGGLFIADFLCGFSLFLAFFVFLYWQNDGAFRFYYLFAAALGFFLFRVALHPLCMRFAEIVVSFFRVLAYSLFLLVYRLFVFVCKLFARPFLPIFRVFVKKWGAFASKIGALASFTPKSAPHAKKEKKSGKPSGLFTKRRAEGKKRGGKKKRKNGAKPIANKRPL